MFVVAVRPRNGSLHYTCKVVEGGRQKAREVLNDLVESLNAEWYDDVLEEVDSHTEAQNLIDYYTT